MSLNFRGSTQFGTIIGGCFSLALTIFFALFIGMQLFAWLFQPSYNDSFSVGYLSREAYTTYDIPVSQFLPTFAIVSNYYTGVSPADWVVNDNTTFTWYFDQQISSDILLPPIAAVSCVELISNMQDLEEQERESILNEIFYKEFMLCPNVTSFQIRGGQLGD